MAGDWIKMRSNLWDDPRVSALCDATDQPEAMVIGALYWLWAAADQHTEDGIMPGLSLRQIDRKTGVAGFAQALCDIGWMADHPEGVRIVNFTEHNGESAKKRCQTAKRVAKSRSGNAVVTQEALQDEHEVVTDALAREREREREREDKDITTPSPEAQEDERLCRWMFDLIAQAVPGVKQPRIGKWTNTVRLMRERDGLTHRRIAEVFTWANRDPFWKTNILSPDKLREKFPQLAVKLEESRGQHNQPARQAASKSERDEQAHREYIARLEREAADADSECLAGVIEPQTCE